MPIKYGTIIFLSAIFVMVIYQAKCTKPEYEIHSDIYIRGKIIDIVRSGNHSFSVYKVAVDTCNFKDTAQVENVKWLMPFKLKAGWCEVYTTTSVEDSVGDFMEVIGSKKLIIVKKPNDEVISEGTFYPVNDPINISFIQRNSMLNQ